LGTFPNVLQQLARRKLIKQVQIVKRLRNHLLCDDIKLPGRDAKVAHTRQDDNLNRKIAEIPNRSRGW